LLDATVEHGPLGFGRAFHEGHEGLEFVRLFGSHASTVRLGTCLSVRPEGHEHVAHKRVGIEGTRKGNPVLVYKTTLIVEQDPTSITDQASVRGTNRIDQLNPADHHLIASERRGLLKNMRSGDLRRFFLRRCPLGARLGNRLSDLA